MTDPYKVLGVSSHDSDEKIKDAYKELVKKYHPDNYSGSPLNEFANEKMSEINSAFDEIMNMRRGGSSSYQGSYQSDYQQGGNSNNPLYQRVRRSILNGEITNAENELESVAFAARDAEWFFLKGSICYKRGWLNEAYSNFEKAQSLEPSNSEYQAAFNQMRNNRQGHMNGNPNPMYRTNNGGGGCSSCDMCTGLICADCCCECAGGDLISCC